MDDVHHSLTKEEQNRPGNINMKYSTIINIDNQLSIESKRNLERYFWSTKISILHNENRALSTLAFGNIDAELWNTIPMIQNRWYTQPPWDIRFIIDYTKNDWMLEEKIDIISKLMTKWHIKWVPITWKITAWPRFELYADFDNLSTILSLLPAQHSSYITKELYNKWSPRYKFMTDNSWCIRIWSYGEVDNDYLNTAFDQFFKKYT